MSAEMVFWFSWFFQADVDAQQQADFWEAAYELLAVYP